MYDYRSVWCPNPSQVFPWCHYRSCSTLVDFTSYIPYGSTTDNGSRDLLLYVQWAFMIFGVHYHAMMAAFIIHQGDSWLSSVLFRHLPVVFHDLGQISTLIEQLWFDLILFITVPSPHLGGILRSGDSYGYGLVGKIPSCLSAIQGNCYYDFLHIIIDIIWWFSICTSR